LLKQKKEVKENIMVKKILIPVFILLLSITASSQTKTAVTSKEAKIVDEINLSDADIEVFKEQTKQKVDEFQQYIVTLGSKDEPAEKRNMAEKEALKLFYKGAQMEISLVAADGSVQKVNRPMEKYLARLKSLPYTKVVIKFYDIAYIRDFTKGPDGKYYSTATIIQEFTGFNKDNIIYTDVTKKDIEIIIDIVEDKFFNEKRWKIFLGDIKASETKTTMP
jgi:transcriptional regulator with PAS, ATPase and Fis domain